MKTLGVFLTVNILLSYTESFSTTFYPKPRSRIFSLHASKSKGSSRKGGKIEFPPNEFSRPLRTEAILGPRRREYTLEISANEEELDALAKRFSLSNIKKLYADLALSRDHQNSSSDAECIQVRGDIVATVTQTCVRTNEDFEVDLEFNMNSIVKACGFRQEDGDLGGLSAADIEGALNAGGGSNRRKGNKVKKEGTVRNSKRDFDSMRIRDIEELLKDFDIDEDIVEDESIFGMDGMIDVGELVAQTFRLRLDPYPKKPGSEPVNYSITG